MKYITPLLLLAVFISACKTAEPVAAQIEIIDGPQIISPENLSPTTPPKVTDWYKGDVILSQTFCKDETSIMKVVLADTKSIKAVKDAMYQNVLRRTCIMIARPMPVPILDIITQYVDHQGRQSVVLQVALPRFLGAAPVYIIAGGRRGPPKEKGRPA